jgi:hypothetical protein
MESPSSSSAGLSSLLRAHEALEACIRDMDASPPAVLDAGRTLLDFARREDEMFGALARWLDPVVLKEMATEHDEIRLDLELLEWLLTTTPESPDAATLAESLARRMQQHVSRDGRLLSRAARLPGGSQPG